MSKMNAPEHFAKRMERLALQQDRTIDDVCHAAEIDAIEWYKIQWSLALPADDVVERLALVLGYPPDFLASKFDRDVMEDLNRCLDYLGGLNINRTTLRQMFSAYCETRTLSNMSYRAKPADDRVFRDFYGVHSFGDSQRVPEQTPSIQWLNDDSDEM